LKGNGAGLAALAADSGADAAASGALAEAAGADASAALALTAGEDACVAVGEAAGGSSAPVAEAKAEAHAARTSAVSDITDFLSCGIDR
jgi:hypothetical protein